MTAAANTGVATVEFRGGTYEVSVKALHSMRVQKAMAMPDDDQPAFWRALDAICNGHLDEYIDNMPDKNGNVSEYGASVEDMMAFFQAASEAFGKN